PSRPPRTSMLSIEISIEHAPFTIDQARIRRAGEAILREAGFGAATISIAIVDDPTIHELNRQYLSHDYPTDVLSFLLEKEDNRLEGEVICSADTAARSAAEFGWSSDDELLLYAIHGLLHLVGHDDDTPEAREAMRQAEAKYLAAVGL